MSKTIIEVKCTDQVLTLTNTPVIASGGVGEDFVSAEFCEKWDDYALALLFWRKGVDPIPVLPDADGFFPVPAELTGVDGVVYFGAVGYDANGNRRTSEAISYRLEAGAITEGTELPAPSGDVFDQIMAYYADAKLYVATRIDEAADAALAAGANAQAAQVAAENAEQAANKVIYTGIMNGSWLSSDGAINIYKDEDIDVKALLSFCAPCASSEAEKVLFVNPNGVVISGDYFLVGSSGLVNNGGAFEKGDHVVAMFDRSTSSAYILNPRVTKEALDEVGDALDEVGDALGQRLHPGLPASVTVDGSMTVSLDYEPEDKMILVFVADAASAQVNGFWLEYETAEDGLIQAGYSLCDANDSPVSEYAFYQGDYVVALLTPSDNRATMLNPRLTRNATNAIQPLVNSVNKLNSNERAGQVFEYTGDGTVLPLHLEFYKPPKVIQIESFDPAYRVSALLFKNEKVAKIRSFIDGYENEWVAEMGEYALWSETTGMIDLFLSQISPESLYLNGKNIKYVAIGFF